MDFDFERMEDVAEKQFFGWLHKRLDYNEDAYDEVDVALRAVMCHDHKIATQEARDLWILLRHTLFEYCNQCSDAHLGLLRAYLSVPVGLFPNEASTDEEKRGVFGLNCRPRRIWFLKRASPPNLSQYFTSGILFPDLGPRDLAITLGVVSIFCFLLDNRNQGFYKGLWDEQYDGCL